MFFILFHVCFFLVFLYIEFMFCLLFIFIFTNFIYVCLCFLFGVVYDVFMICLMVFEWIELLICISPECIVKFHLCIFYAVFLWFSFVFSMFFVVSIVCYHYWWAQWHLIPVLHKFKCSKMQENPMCFLHFSKVPPSKMKEFYCSCFLLVFEGSGRKPGGIHLKSKHHY